MQSSDLVLHLIDATNPADVVSLPQELLPKTITVFSKADLLPPGHKRQAGAIYCSVMQANGIDELSQSILSRLMLDEDILAQPIITNTRHIAAVNKCHQALLQAEQALADGLGYEFIAFDLISASAALEEILGVVTTDEMLESIFSNFCIGK